MSPVTLSLVADDLIRQALREDITYEDVSTAAVCPGPRQATVELIAKEEGVIAGLAVFERTFQLLDPGVRLRARVADGDEVHPGQCLAEVEGDARALLSGERVALNYLQRMSGIATCARRMARLLEGSRTRLVDTRKTCPNMRVFEREAVRAGGAGNHRYNLSTAVMLKDNHIDAATGTVRLKARFPNQDEALYPNQFVNARLMVRMLKDAVTIPASAVQLGSRGSYVYVVSKDDKGDDIAHVREVTPGISTDRLTVIDKGLKAGEVVVVDGLDRLRGGIKVKVAATVETPKAEPVE